MSQRPRRQATLGLPNIEQGTGNSTTSGQYNSSYIQQKVFPNPVCTADEHKEDPPLLIKVTGYHILNTALVLGLGIWKSIATYRNEAVVSTGLDLVLGVILAVMYALRCCYRLRSP